MKIPYSDNQNKRELDSNIKCFRKSVLYLYTVQNVSAVYTKPQHLLTALFSHVLPLQVAACNVHFCDELPTQLYRL